MFTGLAGDKARDDARKLEEENKRAAEAAAAEQVSDLFGGGESAMAAAMTFPSVDADELSAPSAGEASAAPRGARVSACPCRS